MKTAVIGGTFNPVHNGHLYIGEEIRIQGNYERVFYIPSHIPPHKQNVSSVAPVRRMEMLSLALEKNEGIVLDCEMTRGGISYTIDTIQFLYENYSISGKIGLVIGDDLVKGFKNWFKWRDLVSMVDLLVVHRNFKDDIKFDVPHRYFSNLMLPFSSENIRKRISEGKAFRHLVPESVYFYIKKYGLYRV